MPFLWNCRLTYIFSLTKTLSSHVLCVTKQLRIVFKIVYTHTHCTYCSFSYDEEEKNATQNIFQACLYFTTSLKHLLMSDRSTLCVSLRLFSSCHCLFCLDYFFSLFSRFFVLNIVIILSERRLKGTHKKCEEKHTLVQLRCWFLVCAHCMLSEGSLWSSHSAIQPARSHWRS